MLAKKKTTKWTKPKPVEILSRALPVHNKLGLRFAIGIRKRQGALKRLKKAPRLEQPSDLEAAYLLTVKRVMAGLRDEVRRRLVPEIPRLTRLAPKELRQNVRQDAFDDELDRLIEDIRIDFVERVEPAFGVAVRRIGREVAERQGSDHTETFERVLAIRPSLDEPWLRDVSDNFVRTNVRAVEDLTENALDTIERHIGDGIRQGHSVERITEDILDDLGDDEESIVKGRAALLASDQVTSLYGDLARIRQEALGIRRYTWVTSRDERVRPSHRERDGEVFEWGRPIEEQLEEKGFEVDDIDGHPGRPIRCRCIALPDIEGLIDELEGDEA